MEDENEGFMEAAAKLLDPLEHELWQGWLTAQMLHVIFQKNDKNLPAFDDLVLIWKG